MVSNKKMVDEVTSRIEHPPTEQELREQTRRSIARLISIQRGANTWDDEDYTTAGNILIVCSRLIDFPESHSTLNDEDLELKIELITQTMLVALSEWQAGAPVNYTSIKANGRRELFNLIKSRDKYIALDAQIALVESAETLVPTGSAASDEIWFTTDVSGERTPMRQDTLLTALRELRNK